MRAENMNSEHSGTLRPETSIEGENERIERERRFRG